MRDIQAEIYIAILGHASDVTLYILPIKILFDLVGRHGGIACVIEHEYGVYMWFIPLFASRMD